MAMYCSKCGKHYPDDANFCMGCGVPRRINLPVCHFRQPRPLLVKKEGKIDQS